ncbi:MAG TPA: nucleoside hydrolase, partial [Ktedonobacteraceae bacterium]|nr:nucleoside hydrolase [Ktedonobacteraceae bacterium]
QGSAISRLIQQMVENFLTTFGLPRGITAFQMHDPLCLFAAIQPDIITWEPAYVDVEISSSLTLGETVGYFSNLIEDIDPSLEQLHSANMLTSVGVDVERFIATFVERIQSTFSFDKPREIGL